MKIYLSLGLVLGLCLPIFAQKNKTKEAPKAHFSSLLKTPDEIAKIEDRQERFYQLFCGKFNNKAQADTASSAQFVAQETVCVPIWTNRVGERWIYARWSPVAQPEIALGHTIYKLERLNRDSMRLINYGIPESWLSEAPMAWEFPVFFEQFSPKDLQRLPEACDAFVLQVPDNPLLFKVTSPQVCPSSLGEGIAGTTTDLEVALTYRKVFVGLYNGEGQLLFRHPEPWGLYFERLNLVPVKGGKKKKS